MTNNNRVEWFLDGEIQATCESCKFPRHDGPCGSASSFLNQVLKILCVLSKWLVNREIQAACRSASSFLNQDNICTLNIHCPDCKNECYDALLIRRISSFPVKLTFEERMTVFDNFDRDDLENTYLFKGFKGSSDAKSWIKFLQSIPWEATFIHEDEFKRQLEDSIHIMSSSGKQLWKTMFGNVEESIHLLWRLRCVSSHLFSHQMAYFLSVVGTGDKASFLSRGEIHCIPDRIRPVDMYILISSIGLDRIKAMIENAAANMNTDALVPALLLFVAKNQRKLEQAGELNKDHVGKLACRFGMQYVPGSSHPSMFSLDGYCPLEIMEISPVLKSSKLKKICSRLKLKDSSRFQPQPQYVRATAQLVHKKEVHSQNKNIEVSINVRNVRCHILSDNPGDQEKYFPSRIQIRVIPCEKRTQILIVGKSSNDAPRTLSREENWEGGMHFPKCSVDVKLGGKFGSSTTATNWRFEMNECLDNSKAGYFEWTLSDNSSAGYFEVWSADSKNYRQLMGGRSSLRDRGSLQNSPFTRDGGCTFSDDSYGQPLTWLFDRTFEGTTNSWTVQMNVWLTYCYNVSPNDCFQTASWTFTESLDVEL